MYPNNYLLETFAYQENKNEEHILAVGFERF